MTGQPPKLNPVAAPTGAYVRPGRPGPKLLDFNFDALAKMSGSLMDYAAAQDQRDFQDAQTIGLPHAAKLSKDVLPVLTAGGEVTKEHLAQAGITGPANPYAKLKLQQAAAVQQIRDLGFSGHLNNAAFLRENARLYNADPQAADAALQARVSKFVKATKTPMDPISQQAAENEIFREMEGFRNARANLAPKIFEEDEERAHSLIWNQAAKGWAQALHGSQDGPVLKAQIEQIKSQVSDYITNSAKTIGAATAEKTILSSFRSMAVELAQKGDENVQHYLDMLDEAWGDKSSDAEEELDRIRYQVSSAERDLLQSKEKRTEAARNEISSAAGKAGFAWQAANPNATKSEYARQFFEEGGQINALVLDIAKKHGLTDDELGDLRTTMLDRTWIGDRRESDPAALEAGVRLAQAGSPGFDTWLSTDEGKKLTAQDRVGLIQQHFKASQADENTEGARGIKARVGDTIKSQFRGLPETSLESLGSVLTEAELAFNAHLSSKPQDYRGAEKAALDAAKSSPQWEELKTAVNSQTYANLITDKEFDSFVKNLSGGVAEKALAAMAEAAKEAGRPMDPTKVDGVRLRAAVALEDAMQTAVDEELAKPEVRALPHAQKMMRVRRAAQLAAADMAPKLADGAPAAGKMPLDSGARFATMVKDQGPESIGVQTWTAVAPRRDASGQLVSVYQSKRFSEHMAWVRERMQEAASPTGTITPGGSTSFGAYGLFTDSREVVANAAAAELALSHTLLAKAPPPDAVSRSPLEQVGQGIGADVTAARQNLIAHWTIRGLSLDEIISGSSDFGVPLAQVFKPQGDSTDWRSNAPWLAIPMFDSEAAHAKALEDWGRAGENSKLGRAMKALGLEASEIPKFMGAQKALVARNQAMGPIRQAMQALSTTQSVPAWAAPRIQHLKSRTGR